MRLRLHLHLDESLRPGRLIVRDFPTIDADMIMPVKLDCNVRELLQYVTDLLGLKGRKFACIILSSDLWNRMKSDGRIVIAPLSTEN